MNEHRYQYTEWEDDVLGFFGFVSLFFLILVIKNVIYLQANSQAT